MIFILLGKEILQRILFVSGYIQTESARENHENALILLL